MKLKMTTMPTKAQRKKDIEDGAIMSYEDDEVRIQIAEAIFPKSHLLLSSSSQITFRDAEGRLWVSTEPYTLVVTKEVNSDDEQADESKLD